MERTSRLFIYLTCLDQPSDVICGPGAPARVRQREQQHRPRRTAKVAVKSIQRPARRRLAGFARAVPAADARRPAPTRTALPSRRTDTAAAGAPQPARPDQRARRSARAAGLHLPRLRLRDVVQEARRASAATRGCAPPTSPPPDTREAPLRPSRTPATTRPTSTRAHRPGAPAPASRPWPQRRAARARRRRTRGTRRAASRPCPRPAPAAIRPAARRSSRRRPAYTPSSEKIRPARRAAVSAAASVTRDARSRIAASVAGSSSNPSSAAMRTPRSSRSESASNTSRAVHPHEARRKQSSRPPPTSISGAAIERTARASMVKSRAAAYPGRVSPATARHRCIAPALRPARRAPPRSRHRVRRVPGQRARDLVRDAHRVAIDGEIGIARGPPEQHIVHRAADDISRHA